MATKDKPGQEKARQAKEEAIRRVAEATGTTTLAEGDIAVVKIEVRAPGGLVGRPILGVKKTDPAGDGADALVFDGNTTDRDNRVGNTDAD